LVGGIPLLQPEHRSVLVNQERKNNMYKNMTRKGLALGAGLALVASGLTAAPAQAVETGLLWSAYGQSNEMVGVNGSIFTLRVGNPTATASFSSNAINVGAAVVATQVQIGNQAAKSLTVTAFDLAGGADEEGLRVSVASPVADETYQYDIYIRYSDGSRSETERVTFVPKEDVSTSLAINPVKIGDSAITGSLSFAGINTENFVESNFSSGFADDASASANHVTAKFTQDTVARALTASYNSIVDAYLLSANLTPAVEDVYVLTAKVGTSEANAYFNSDADAAEAEFTVSATNAVRSMEIFPATSATVKHNNGATTVLIEGETVVAAEGTKVLNFIIQAYSDTAKLVPAAGNNAVTVTLTDVANRIGTTTITAEGKTLNVAGSSISFTKNTNTSGQIAFTVTADKAADLESFTIDARSSLGATPAIDTTKVEWQEAAWTLLPAVDGNFTIAPKGSLAVDYTVVNQFGVLADADYQLTFTRAAGAGARDTAAEYANWSYVAPVSATGRASVTIVDNGAADTEGLDTVSVALQKKATSGTGYLSVPGVSDTFTLRYENDLAAMKVSALTNYNGIANAAGTALEPLKLETKTLVDYDQRLAGVKPEFNTNGTGTAGNVPTSGVGVTPVTYGTGMLRVHGVVQTASNAGIAGVAVKISGTGANFANSNTIADASQMRNDSIVVFTDSTGSYEAFVRSSVAGLQTIAIDAQGVTSSVQVRFQESTGVATGMTLSVPSAVAPGARADIVATVVDKFGKPVTGVVVNFKDNGPGVLNSATATTDIFGQAQVTLSTVAAESGSTTITAFATIAGVNVVQVATITVGASAALTDGKVNVGSFNGKLVVYALNLDGAKISWKVAGRWGVANAVGNTLNRFDRPVGAAGRNVIVEIYVNGVRQLQKTVLTR
jgi:hypothetical protein